MDELTRFARALVEQLGTSKDGVHRPIAVGVLRDTILPYRKHRRALGIESVEDYETVLLRLVAGERGYVRTVPIETAERCRKELAQANPDLGVLDEVAESTVQITSMAAAQIVGDDPVSEVAPEPSPPVASPEPPVVIVRAPKRAPPADPEPMRPAMPAPVSQAAEACSECKKPVPTGRPVVFCPWCAHRLIPFTCARCHTELDSEWHHCITCGAPVQDPFRYR